MRIGRQNQIEHCIGPGQLVKKKNLPQSPSTRVITPGRGPATVQWRTPLWALAGGAGVRRSPGRPAAAAAVHNSPHRPLDRGRGSPADGVESGIAVTVTPRFGATFTEAMSAIAFHVVRANPGCKRTCATQAPTGFGDRPLVRERWGKLTVCPSCACPTWRRRRVTAPGGSPGCPHSATPGWSSTASGTRRQPVQADAERRDDQLAVGADRVLVDLHALRLTRLVRQVKPSLEQLWRQHFRLGPLASDSSCLSHLPRCRSY